MKRGPIDGFIVIVRQEPQCFFFSIISGLWVRNRRNLRKHSKQPSIDPPPSLIFAKLCNIFFSLGDNCQILAVRSDNCQIGQLSVRTTVSADNCQWGQLSVGTTVSGDNCQWGQLSVAQLSAGHGQLSEETVSALKKL